MSNKPVRRAKVHVVSGHPVFEHDARNYSLPKLPRASPIELGEIWGVLPFDGVRNPSARSSSSHKVFLTYRTPANDWRPKVGIAESAAEAAVALEAVMSPATFDVSFQPLQVRFRDEDGAMRSYTHDLLITFRNGRRRLVFVRNAESLGKPRTAREIRAIVAATPKHAADDMIVVDANDYTRQRRENLMRMHHFVFHPDDEADEALLETARSLTSFYYMKDLFPHAPVSQPRAFAACHRLVARGALRANLDHVLWENSHLPWQPTCRLSRHRRRRLMLACEARPVRDWRSSKSPVGRHDDRSPLRLRARDGDHPARATHGGHRTG